MSRNTTVSTLSFEIAFKKPLRWFIMRLSQHKHLITATFHDNFSSSFKSRLVNRLESLNRFFPACPKGSRRQSWIWSSNLEMYTVCFLVIACWFFIKTSNGAILIKNLSRRVGRNRNRRGTRSSSLRRGLRRALVIILSTTNMPFSSQQ